MRLFHNLIKTSISCFVLFFTGEGGGKEEKFWNRPVTQRMHFSITMRHVRYVSRPRAQTEVAWSPEVFERSAP